MEKKQIDKNDAIDILDRTIAFNQNCDTKASITLGIVGLFITKIFTTDGIKDIVSVSKNLLSDKNWSNIGFIFLSCVSILFILKGLFHLILVMQVNIDFFENKKSKLKNKKYEQLVENSLIYFKSIQNNSYKEYENKLLGFSSEEQMKDIISQIYINSSICNKKYERYKKGYNCLLIGFISFFVFWLISHIIF